MLRQTRQTHKVVNSSFLLPTMEKMALDCLIKTILPILSYFTESLIITLSSCGFLMNEGMCVYDSNDLMTNCWFGSVVSKVEIIQ